MRELAINTNTEDNKMGSHREVRVTTVTSQVIENGRLGPAAPAPVVSIVVSRYVCTRKFSASRVKATFGAGKRRAPRVSTDAAAGRNETQT